MPNVFISYRRDDSAYAANSIKEKLEDAFGASSVFFDIDKIPIGVDFREHINSAVAKCDMLLVLIGDRWIEQDAGTGARRLDDPADFVRLEIEAAIKREIPLIPVLIGKASMPAEDSLPAPLRELAFRNAAEVRSGRDQAHHLKQLIKGLQQLADSQTRKSPIGKQSDKSRKKKRPVKQKPHPTPEPTSKSSSAKKTYNPELLVNVLESIKSGLLSLVCALLIGLVPGVLLALTCSAIISFAGPFWNFDAAAIIEPYWNMGLVSCVLFCATAVWFFDFS